MKFIIFICSHIQHGEYPRLPDFPYNQEFQKYIYQGRELTLEEFNAAAPIVFAPNYRSNGYRFCPLATPIETPVTVEIPAPATPGPFRLEGKSIFAGDERVAGLYGDEKQLRVFKDDIRPAIEAWLQTLTTTEP